LRRTVFRSRSSSIKRSGSSWWKLRRGLVLRRSVTLRGAMSALRSDPPSATRTSGQTVGSVWRAAADAPITYALLEWPAGLFAVTSVLLADAQAFRFALSPPTGQQWPPPKPASWSDAVERTAHEWRRWVEEPVGPAPAQVAEEFEVLLEGVQT